MLRGLLSWFGDSVVVDTRVIRIIIGHLTVPRQVRLSTPRIFSLSVLVIDSETRITRRHRGRVIVIIVGLPSSRLSVPFEHRIITPAIVRLHVTIVQLILCDSRHGNRGWSRRQALPVS